MGEIVIPDTFRVALNWVSAGGQTATNVIWVGNDSNDEIATAGAVLESLEQHMFEGVSEDFTLTSVVCTLMESPNRTGEIDGGGFNSGSGSGQFSPASCAVVKHTTALGGRSHRGRNYIGPLRETVIQDGRLGPGVAGEIADAWNLFRANLLTSSVPSVFVVASVKLETATAVFNTSCSDIVGTQRRRQGRLWQ